MSVNHLQRESVSYKRLRELKLEPPTPERLERLIRSAVTTTEKKFCASIFGQLSMPSNSKVKILNKKNGWICLTPLDAQAEPSHLVQLKREINQRWHMTSLLDMLKETDLRIGFTNQFKNTGVRSNLNRDVLQRRALLSLYGLGTNTGLTRVCTGMDNDTETDLRYFKKHYIHREHLRNAIAEVVNATLAVRKKAIWGEGTTACASDSKKFGSWDQNRQD
jgi:hypothetical protein